MRSQSLTVLALRMVHFRSRAGGSDGGLGRARDADGGDMYCLVIRRVVRHLANWRRGHHDLRWKLGWRYGRVLGAYGSGHLMPRLQLRAHHGRRRRVVPV